MKTKLTLALIAIMLIIACSTVPLTGRKQLRLLPESMLTGMALTQYNEFLSTNKVVTQTEQAVMVKNVGDKLAHAATRYLSQHGQAGRVAGYQWEFNLVQDNSVNAWCMPGGKVVIYSGILPITQTEEGLAVVMGHEIAHAIARHGNERMSQMLTMQMGGIALDVAMMNQPNETRQLFNTAYSIGSTVGVMLPFSRKHESEADRLGLVFMAMAGYNPVEAVGFWRRMSSVGGAKPPQFMSTHPSDEKRIKNIKKHMGEALKYYKPK